MPNFFAIVPAAGSGARFGAPSPKQYLPLLGKPLLYHTLHALCCAPSLVRVTVVLSPDDDYWPQYDWSVLGGKLDTVFSGGATRALSVRAGLAALATAAADDDWVLVHDAARPCLTEQQIETMIHELADDPVGGLLAVPVADTLKRADAAQRVAVTVARDGLWQAQTPQMFRYGLLTQALAQFPEVTDEAGAVEALGKQAKLVRGSAANLKVTFPADLALAEIILRGRF